MSSIAASNDPTAPLWRTLRDFIVEAFSLFGAPHEIAQFGVRLREEHKLFLHYLRQCETLLRKLLFIEALALAASTPPPARGRLGEGQRKRRFHEQDPENSETWRVSFHVCADMERRRPRQQESPREQTMPAGRRRSISRFVSTWPSAERFEALLRAFNDPAPYVKRLARLIRRKPQLARVEGNAPARQYGQSVLEEEIRDAALLIRARRKESDSS